MASSLSATSECNAELAALVRHIAEHFGAHVATLYRYDPDHDVFFSPVGVGLRDPGTFEQGKPRSDRIAGKVVKRRKPIIAEDARGHEDMRGPFTHRERIASAAGFPLMFQDRPVGVFFLSYRSPHTFTTEEVAEIEASLVEVTVAMGNMAAEFPAGEAISVAERQLRLILESACTSTGASFGLFRLDRDAARLVIRSATGLRQAFIRSAAVALNTDNVFARAFHTDTPVFVEDLADAGSFPFPEERDFEEWHSLLVAPVRVSGRPAAVLAAFSSASGGFKPSERRLVTEMAMQMGSVLTGERQNRVVSDLQEISTALVAKGLALRDVLELIAQRAQYTFDAPIVTLYPYDEEYHEFDVPIALGIKRPFWAHPTPSEDGLAAQIARTKREWICPDVEEDPGVAGRRFIVVHEVRSSAGFPLRIADEVVAVMFVNYRAPYAFTSDDRSLMALFGSHAALAIKQARLLQAEQRRATMAEIARTFTDSFNRERVLQAVVDGAVTLTDANSCSLWLDDPKSGGFALEARSPALRNPGQDTPRHERGLSRQIVDTGTPVLIPDALSDTRVRQSVKDEGTRSILGVPVRIWGRPVGALYLNSPRENHFRKRDVGLLTSLADYGAIALERMPRRLSEAAENVNKATGEILWLDERIEALLNEIVNGLGFEFAAVQLINAERQEIETVSGFNTPWSGEARHRLDSRDIQADVLRSGETLIIAGWDDRFDRAIYDAYGHSDLVRVFTPLRADGHFVGTVEAGYHMSAHPDITLEERDALCQAVARHAETIHCATLQHVLGVIIDNAVRMVRADSGSIHLRYDEDRGRFDYEALAGARIDQAFLDAFPPRSSTGLGWRVLQDGKPAWEDDPQQLAAANPGIYAPQALWAKDPIRYPQGQGVRAIACLPLALPDSPYKGLFYVHFWSPHKFGQDEIEALELLARQVSVGIQNAQVFGEQRDLARALASMSTVGRSLAKKVELGSLLYEIAEKASTVLRADLVNIYEYHEKDEYFDTPPKVFGELRFPTPMHSAVFPGDAPRELLAARHNIFATDAAKNLVLCRRTSRPDAAAKDPFIVREGIQSAAGVLLRAQDEVVGVMFVNYRCQRNFSYTDRSAIESFATYAALAVQTARNLTQTQVDTFGHLRRVSTAIMSFAELRAVLNQIAASSCSLLGATDAVILPRDPVTGRWLTEQAAHSGQGDAPFPLGEPRPEGWTEMVRHQGLVVVPDVAKAVRTAGIPGGAGMESLKARAFMGVALSSGDAAQGPLGVLYVDYDSPRTFTPAQQKLIQAFADQAAIAIQIARLVEDQRRQLDSLAALHEFVGEAAKLTEEDELLKRIVSSVCDTVKASSATLFTRPEGEQLQQVAHCGDDGRLVAQQAARPGSGLIGEAYEAAAAPPIDRSARATARTAPPVTMLPIWVEGQVWGLIVAERNEDAPFDERDTILLQTMAIQAGIALAQQRRQRRRADAIAKRFNPYQVGEVITEPEAFYGRTELIEDILSGVENNHYILYGERRIGKSSLLHQLQRWLKKAAEDGEGARFYPILISLQGVPQDGFFAELRNGIAGGTEVEMPPVAPGAYDAERFRADFLQILKTLRGQNPDRIVRVVLLLDEMDSFVHYDSSLHERFRSLFTHRDFVALKLIMAGVSIREVTTITSPWYNLFQPKQVAELTRAVARQLIEGPVRAVYAYQPKAREQVIKWSDYKPLAIQALCYGSVQAMHQRLASARGQPVDAGVITVADVDNAIEVEYRKLCDEYELLWQKLSEEQRAAIRRTLETDNKAPLDLDAPGLGPTGLFSHSELYPITRSTAQGRRLTQMFMRWLKERTA